MKTSVLAALTLLPVAALAQSPIEGTWRPDLASYSKAARPVVYMVEGGMFECVSCPTPYRVKADGKDQPVAGHDRFDTIAIRIAGNGAVETVTRKAGKLVEQSTWTLDTDKAGLTRKTISHAAGGAKAQTEEAKFRRVAAPAGGRHWLSGAWLRTAYTAGTTSRTVFRIRDGQLSMSSPDGGGSYTARLDGTPAPLVGDTPGAMVSVRLKGPNAFEEVLLKDGKPVMTTVMTVDSSGRKATVEWTHEAVKQWEAKYRRDKALSSATGSYLMNRE